MIVKEGLRVTFTQVLAIVTFMHNAMTVINGSTPYQALIGRQPQLFPSLEGGTLEERGVEEPLVNSRMDCRHNARVREIAAEGIIESIATSRIEQAQKSKTRPDMRLEQYQRKELVDIWFEPSNKDTKGWRGPAEVVSIHPEDGNAEIRIQGRTLLRRAPEIRPHIPYFIFLQLVYTSHFTYWLYIRGYIEEKADVLYDKVYGIVWHSPLGQAILNSGTSRSGWMMTPQSMTKEEQYLFQRCLAFAQQSSYLPNCTTIRIIRGHHKVSMLQHFHYSELLIWHPQQQDIHGNQEDPLQYSAEPGDFDTKLHCKELCQQLRVVQNGRIPWQEVYMLQLFGVADDDREEVIRLTPTVPALAGAGYHRPSQPGAGLATPLAGVDGSDPGVVPVPTVTTGTGPIPPAAGSLLPAPISHTI